MTRDQGFCTTDSVGNLAGHDHWYPVGYFLFSWLVWTMALSLDLCELLERGGWCKDSEQELVVDV